MPPSSGETSPLERYGHNLTTLAQQGAFFPLAVQEAVVDRAFQILLRNNKSNPMFLDFDEARRFATVIEVVRRMTVGDAPDPLSQRQVIALDFEALFANPLGDALLYQERIEQVRTRLLKKLAESEQASDKKWQFLIEKGLLQPEAGEWIAPLIAHERLQTMCLATYQTVGSFILFVDNFHCIVGGGDGEYPLDAATMLVPMLARRQIQLIGACALEQYHQYIERDAALQRRFQEIVLPH